MILMASRRFHETCGDNSENSEDSDAFTRLAGSNYKGCDATPVIIMRDLYGRDFGIISIIAIMTLTLLFAGAPRCLLDGKRDGQSTLRSSISRSYIAQAIRTPRQTFCRGVGTTPLKGGVKLHRKSVFSNPVNT
jgi:hypothetical protein